MRTGHVNNQRRYSEMRTDRIENLDNTLKWGPHRRLGQQYCYTRTSRIENEYQYSKMKTDRIVNLDNNTLTLERTAWRIKDNTRTWEWAALRKKTAAILYENGPHRELGTIITLQENGPHSYLRTTVRAWERTAYRNEDSSNTIWKRTA